MGMSRALNLTEPFHFSEAALLIDLVDFEDRSIPKAQRVMTLGHMASTGELAYNMRKHVMQHGGSWGSREELQVEAQGILTIGWIWPASAWGWICCPTWFAVCPVCVVQLLLCCV